MQVGRAAPVCDVCITLEAVLCRLELVIDDLGNCGASSNFGFTPVLVTLRARVLASCLERRSISIAQCALRSN